MVVVIFTFDSVLVVKSNVKPPLAVPSSLNVTPSSVKFAIISDADAGETSPANRHAVAPKYWSRVIAHPLAMKAPDPRKHQV